MSSGVRENKRALAEATPLGGNVIVIEPVDVTLKLQEFRVFWNTACPLNDPVNVSPSEGGPPANAS